MFVFRSFLPQPSRSRQTFSNYVGLLGNLMPLLLLRFQSQAVPAASLRSRRSWRTRQCQIM